ncbi:MAG TPA: hypothetical protein VFP12_11780 [Allosphingosinicella sp.]|nr:hypothetical protein [Allosphingosinicella sp.]
MTSIPQLAELDLQLIRHPAPAIGMVAFVENSGSPGLGWTWTTYLGELIAAAEAAYGPRDRSWTILGVEFGGDIPMIWYPGNRGHVAVRLTTAAATCPRVAFSELAHEAIHLLAPTGGSTAPNFEEGLATLFAESQSAVRGVTPGRHPAYDRPRNEVAAMLMAFPDFVRDIRAVEPSFPLWTPELLDRHAPGTSDEVLAYLCRPFDRGS